MFFADMVILKNIENQLSSLISAVSNNPEAISSSKLPFEGTFRTYSLAKHVNIDLNAHYLST